MKIYFCVPFLIIANIFSLITPSVLLAIPDDKLVVRWISEPGIDKSADVLHRKMRNKIPFNENFIEINNVYTLQVIPQDKKFLGDPENQPWFLIPPEQDTLEPLQEYYLSTIEVIFNDGTTSTTLWSQISIYHKFSDSIAKSTSFESVFGDQIISYIEHGEILFLLIRIGSEFIELKIIFPENETPHVETYVSQISTFNAQFDSRGNGSHSVSKSSHPIELGYIVKPECEEPQIAIRFSGSGRTIYPREELVLLE